MKTYPHRWRPEKGTHYEPLLITPATGWRRSSHNRCPCRREPCLRSRQSRFLQSAGTLAQALDRQTAVLAGLHLEIGKCSDQLGKAGVAVIAHREARHRLGALAKLGKRGIALVVALGGLESGAQDIEQLLVYRLARLGIPGRIVVASEGSDVE